MTASGRDDPPRDPTTNRQVPAGRSLERQDRRTRRGACSRRCDRSTMFFLSRNTANQQVAQGHSRRWSAQFSRASQARLQMKEAARSAWEAQAESQQSNGRSTGRPDLVSWPIRRRTKTETDGSAPATAEGSNGAPKLTLKDLEHRKRFRRLPIWDDGPTMVSQIKPRSRRPPAPCRGRVWGTAGTGNARNPEAEDEVYIRDAYLVFRSFCNLLHQGPRPRTSSSIFAAKRCGPSSSPST